MKTPKLETAALLPEAEIRNFFGLRLSRFPDSFRSEVSAYFNLPFDYVLKRALHMGAVSEEVAEENRSNRQPIRATALRRPTSRRAA